MNKGTIIYPIETKKRETDGVILLGLKMAQLGYSFILGPKKELNYQVAKYKPNIFVASNASMYRESEILFSYLKKIGTEIIIIDTEGGVIIDENYKKRHDVNLAKLCSTFFAWGERVKPLLIEGSKIPLEKIVVAGCPWFDLLKDVNKAKTFYKFEINQIEKEYGNNFILYNSRFSGNNLFNKVLEKEIAENYSNNSYYQYSNVLFNELNDLLEKLANEFPDKKLIIRPHPSESKDYYLKRFKKYKNVFVDERFNVRSWCVLSKVMIHNGCTTAIESSMLGIPTISYQPIENEEFDIKLPNLAGIKLTSSEEVTKNIQALYNSNSSKFELSSKQIIELNSYIANFTISSIDVISSCIAKKDLQSINNRFDLDFWLLRFKIYLSQNHLRLISFFFKKKGANLKSFQDYVNHKFPKMEKDEFEQRFNACVEFLELNKDDFKYEKIESMESSYILELSTKE